MTGTGKISRLPHAIREQVCRRLLDGHSASAILAWLNATPEARQVCNSAFDGVPISENNLSEYRRRGYADWIRQREKVEHLKTLSSFASDLAKNGGDISDGAAAIAGGIILEALESAGDILAVPAENAEGKSESPAEGIAKLARAVAALQQAAAAKTRIGLDKQRIAQRDVALALDREKYETQTITKFLEWAKSPEALAILDSGKPRHIQMDALRTLMYGQ